MGFLKRLGNLFNKRQDRNLKLTMKNKVTELRGENESLTMRVADLEELKALVEESRQLADENAKLEEEIKLLEEEIRELIYPNSKYKRLSLNI